MGLKKSGIVLSMLMLSAVSYGANSLIDRVDNGGRTNWRASYFNLASRPMNNPKEGTAQVFTYNYFSIDYKKSYDQKYSIRPVFHYSTSGYDNYGAYQKPKAELGDLYVQYVDYSLAYLPGDVSLSGQFRLHLPTGKASKEISQISRFEGVFIFEKLLANQLSLSLEVRPSYYWQSQTNYLRTWTYVGGSRDGELGGRVSQTKEYKLEQTLSLEKKWNKLFGTGLSVGLTSEGYHNSEVENVDSRHNHELTLGTSFLFDVSHTANFILSIENTAPIHNARRNYKPLRDDEMSATLLSFIRF